MSDRISSANDELRDMVYKFAADLAKAEPDPASWGTWLVLLAEALEAEAYERNLDPDIPVRVELALERVRNAIGDRLANRRW